MNKQIYYIRGMHCRSCELTLEGKIGALDGVQKVHVDHKKGIAEVYSNEKTPPRSDIGKIVHEAGYELSEKKAEKPPFLSKDIFDYYELLAAVSVVLILYTIGRFLGWFDAAFNFSSAPSWPVVVLIGMVAGISTCMAIVGGLVLGISARHAELHPEATAKQKFRPHLFFNLGRLVSFMILGGVIGAAGSALRISGPVLGFLIAAVGIVMCLLGLKLTELFPRLSNGIMLPKAVSRFFGAGKEVKEYSHRGALITGALTFFLPCGFTQAMQLYAISTGSFYSGAMIMGLFALGTMPGLLGIGGLTAVIRGAVARYFFKFAGVVVIGLGILNIYGGWNLTGITLGSSVPEFSQFSNPVESLEDVEAALKKLGLNSSAAEEETVGDVQIVNMTQNAFAYTPNRFTIKKGVPVEWRINSTNTYTCASTITVPALGIYKSLEQGPNVITFTPKKAGPLKFTCAMGMYSGWFNVID